ncbi:MAG TPA: low molecular weight protein-tyrosine-phosphatase [Rhodocyclaceae bacterium]|jgi:protein-tyrosine phosphatase|nr:low molecular weight phosphotyrosine protein phosphatase [Betaproteobacteria bacterium]HMV00787.1 low molecular weight protein-tyrosine-phosphatase [Rhodocyclaceae bacterium]HMV20935.1 low molecular weight protein-tyrosine-phosphatase [Rhodocyclaceae bacterium]HMW78490.1 low molecular weight protein-tyrosine-phosphatase [Rhodocyclaceae bacterium]HNE42796.1 low molecular weight protein-tyrosine-phosphatase [Rhodocyclaceae bacterium]
MPLNILIVCMGNICRSPMAEEVVRVAFARAGLGGSIRVDSAGTLGSHAGEQPDDRAIQTAAARGYDLSRLRARRVTSEDFSRFDLILAMDADNLATLKRRCPPEHQAKLALFLDQARSDCAEVPDPYYGNLAGFQRVLELCELGAAGLVRAVREGLIAAQGSPNP